MKFIVFIPSLPKCSIMASNQNSNAATLLCMPFLFTLGRNMDNFIVDGDAILHRFFCASSLAFTVGKQAQVLWSHNFYLTCNHIAMRTMTLWLKYQMNSMFFIKSWMDSCLQFFFPFVCALSFVLEFDQMFHASEHCLMPYPFAMQTKLLSSWTAIPLLFGIHSISVFLFGTIEKREGKKLNKRVLVGSLQQHSIYSHPSASFKW